MALNSDKVLMQTLTAQGVGTANSNWFDLSAYVVGAFWIIETVGGTLTPTFQMSPDNGTTNFGTIPTGELATPGAISAPGGIRYPFIGPMNMEFVRVSSAVTVSAVTAQVFFIGRTK